MAGLCSWWSRRWWTRRLVHSYGYLVHALYSAWTQSYNYMYDKFKGCISRQYTRFSITGIYMQAIYFKVLLDKQRVLRQRTCR